MNAKISAIICVTLIIIGILFWPTLYRYDNMTINGNVIPLKTNRLTGFTEYYYSGKWVSQEGQRRKIIPVEERKKITAQIGSALEKDTDPISGTFVLNTKAKIYNGSTWTITDIIIRCKIKEGDSLKLIESGIIPPLKMGEILIKNIDNCVDLEIDEIQGYQD